MTPIQRLIERVDGDLGLAHIEGHLHRARETLYELQVSRAAESGQYRIYVASGGHIHAHIFDPQHDCNCLTGSSAEKLIIDDLVKTAIHDIDENVGGLLDSM